jgi:hypothetical protein
MRQRSLNRQLLTLALGLYAGCGGNTPTPTAVAPTPAPTPVPTPTPSPATLSDLSATVTSPQSEALINCADDVFARVTVTNRSQSSVVVTGIRDSSGVLRGLCRVGADFTYRPSVSLAGPGQTVVMNQSMFTGGSGCCPNTQSCFGATCKFEERMTVITALGEVPAGSFAYFINFIGCGICGSPSATAVGNRCAPHGLQVKP